MKNNLIFLDTETTGLEEGRLIQLAFKEVDKDVFVEYYKPPVQIEFEAMGTHHITEKMVADKKPFQETETFSRIQSILKEGVLVAHNAKYDIDVLKREGVDTERYICTYKVAYRLFDLPNHKLQSLRYRWGIEIDDAVAHDAKGDVIVLEKVFDYLAMTYINLNNVSYQECIDDFIEITKQPTLLRTIPFGKYRGETFEAVKEKDIDYLYWVMNKMENKTEDLIFTLKKHL